MIILRHGILSQSGVAPFVTISPATYTPSISGGTVSVTVTSNVEWAVAERVAYDWLALTSVPAIPFGNGSFDIEVNSRTVAGSARTGYIDVTSSGLVTKTITVTQAAAYNPTAGMTVSEMDMGNWSFYSSSASIAKGSTTLYYSFQPVDLSASATDIMLSVSGDQYAYKMVTARDGYVTSGFITLPNAAQLNDNYTITAEISLF